MDSEGIPLDIYNGLMQKTETFIQQQDENDKLTLMTYAAGLKCITTPEI
jgi:hypothetical protein